MPPRIIYTTDKCPWAALLAAKEIDKARASSYRRGLTKPSRIKLEKWSKLGWSWYILRGTITCTNWPGKGGL